MIVKSQKLRDSARGADCTLRLPGVCSFDPEKTVLAHIPCGMKGMGMKGPDNMAVFACTPCHDAIDGRAGSVEIDYQDVIRALAETQMRWIETGLIKITGVKG